MRQLRFQARLRDKGVQIGPNCQIAETTEVSSGVTFGRGVDVRGHCIIGGDAPIDIGNYTGIATRAQIRASNYDTRYANMAPLLHHRLGLPLPARPSRPINVGAVCWIGTNVLILPGVTVGHGAVIGAGSVVTKDIPPFTIAAGTPARVIRNRFPEDEIARQLELAWWDWPESKMRQNLQLFTQPIGDMT
jgi:acetyltransferase-like isoleucine patch superfamily enzyme